MAPKLKEPIMSAGVLESLSKALADFLSHREVTKYLQECSLEDQYPDQSKWIRMHNAFILFQNRQQLSNNIIQFVQKTIHPSRFVNDQERFEAGRAAVNRCLLFIGRELLDTGKLRLVDAAQTITEAQRRTDELKRKLGDRKVHAQVLLFCRAELLEDNYFHAVFEATKSVAQRIRDLTGLPGDGAPLVDAAMGLGTLNKPLLAINRLDNDSEISEHKGFANLLKGVFGMFRNTTGHAPRISWNLEEEDALDCFTIASLAHRKLDKALVVRS